MFKALLFVCASLLSLHGRTQIPFPDRPSPSEAVTEDSNHVITDLSVFNSDKVGVTLSWKVNNNVPPFYAIERSDNGKSFEVVSVLNNQDAKSGYQWIDEAPKKGRSFYRIRYSFKDGQSLYSKTVSIAIAGYTSFKFYPNPVDHILIVRSDTPLEVQITDGNGKVRMTESRVHGLHTINVSSLEKGIYLIRFSNKLTNVISQEKLVKN
jgi:hypothetical protein